MIPFFSCSEEGWRLSETNVRDAIKASAQYFFNDPAIVNKFTPRSLRVGGASALMLSGSSDSFIQKAGRWKSSTFLDYLRICVSLTQERTAKMCQASSGFSTEAIKKQLPLPVGLVKNWNWLINRAVSPLFEILLSKFIVWVILFGIITFCLIIWFFEC